MGWVIGEGDWYVTAYVYTQENSKSPAKRVHPVCYVCHNRVLMLTTMARNVSLEPINSHRKTQSFTLVTYSGQAQYTARLAYTPL